MFVIFLGLLFIEQPLLTQTLTKDRKSSELHSKQGTQESAAMLAATKAQ